MFSEVQREYVKQLVLSHQPEYQYYIAYTNPNVTGSYTYDEPDFFVILSKEEITASGLYSYSIPDETIMYAVRSGNASSNYHAARLDTRSAPTSLNLNNYVFVYTNAESSMATVQPDLLCTNELRQDTFNGFGVALLIVLLSVIVFRFVRR